MSLNIFFIHKGYNDYLEYSLHQAYFTNPTANIYLLGDKHNNKFKFLDHYNIIDNIDNNFDDWYVHMSTNKYDFEKICIERWYILNYFVKKKKLSDVYVFDSDVLLYSDLAQIQEELIGKKFGLSLPHYQNCYRWTACPHNAYWTKETLNQFCDFMKFIYKKKIDILKQKWNHHVANNKKGGIEDMTLLYLFTKEFNSDEIFNFSKVCNNTVFDFRINLSENEYPDEYKMAGEIKLLFFKNQCPFGIRSQDNKNIKFNSLHFGGKYKKLMKDFYIGPKSLRIKLKEIKNKLL